MSKTCIIKAKAKYEYFSKGFEQAGEQVLIPYKDYNIVMRCLREIWFRLGFPHKDFWFNPEIKNIEADVIKIYDALIVPELVQWICRIHPDKKVCFFYNNRVSKNSVRPWEIIEKNLDYSTFDIQDSEKYGMMLVHPGFLSGLCIDLNKKKEPVYDIIYLGRDKGRAEKLLSLEKQFQDLGLNTYFHICADRRYKRFSKPYYKPEIPYSDYQELLKKTRAHLNVVQDGQTSITQRDMESIFDQVKCITNNQGIKEFELYDPSRYFVLGQDDVKDLPQFLNIPFVPVEEKYLEKYRN